MDYPGSRKIRILMADADAAFGVFVRYSLEQIGFQVTVANDGADLVARFLPKEVDVVLAGVTSAYFDGLQILRAVKKRSPATPVILFCDADNIPRAEEGMQEGAFLYFQKPLHDFIQLGDAITRAYETQVRQHPAPAPVPAAPIEPTVVPASEALVTLLAHQLVDATLTQPQNVTLQLLSAAGAQIMQAPYGIVMLTQPNTRLQVAGVHGFANHEAATLDLAARLGNDFAERVVPEGKTVIVPLSPESANPNRQYAISVPLLTHNETRGALIVYPFASPTVDAARMAQLELVSAQGILALEFIRIREENKRLVTTDPTTGILKREVFLELADREFRRSWRYGQPITVILVDVDDLVNINLKCGHSFGDRVLRQVATVCLNVVRSIDLVGRYEGDEFGLLLLMTENAKIVAERLRIGINAIELPDAPSPIHVTATLGVCTYPREGCTSIFDLIVLAQEAQRAARYRGSNQIVYV